VLAHVKPKRIALVGILARSCSWMGKIHPNRRPWSLFLEDYDYVIAFHSSRFDKEPKSHRLFVMRHELAHIPEDGHEKGSRGYRRCVKHDLEDWKFLRKTYGLNLEKVKRIYKGEKVELE
jgi:predicted metallopeptidase